MTNVTLSSTVRSNLLQLQGTAHLIGRTQERLASGVAVGSPIDDAAKYFQAKALSDRASDLNERKNGIDQGVSTLETVIKATDAIEKLVQQMKGIVDGARSQSAEDRAASASQLSELVDQIQNLVDDATYKGLNLINNGEATLNVRFSEKADSELEVTGVDFNTSAFFLNTNGSALGVSVGTNGVVTDLGFTQALSLYEFTDAIDLADFNDIADTVLKNLDATINNLRAKAATMASNSAILQVRLDFTEDYVINLQKGADKLTLANLNEEGANLLALQTRQQLGIQALAFAGQSEQAILGLFR
jgi:flagellin-like hook-associated protein FlgL